MDALAVVLAISIHAKMRWRSLW